MWYFTIDFSIAMTTPERFVLLFVRAFCRKETLVEFNHSFQIILESRLPIWDYSSCEHVVFEALLRHAFSSCG